MHLHHTYVGYSLIAFTTSNIKYRLEIKREALRGFRNRGKAEVSKPRRAEGTVANRLRRQLICRLIATYILDLVDFNCGFDIS